MIKSKIKYNLFYSNTSDTFCQKIIKKDKLFTAFLVLTVAICFLSKSHATDFYNIQISGHNVQRGYIPRCLEDVEAIWSLPSATVAFFSSPDSSNGVMHTITYSPPLEYNIAPNSRLYRHLPCPGTVFQAGYLGIYRLFRDALLQVIPNPISNYSDNPDFYVYSVYRNQQIYTAFAPITHRARLALFRLPLFYVYRVSFNNNTSSRFVYLPQGDGLRQLNALILEAQFISSEQNNNQISWQQLGYFYSLYGAPSTHDGASGLHPDQQVEAHPLNLSEERYVNSELERHGYEQDQVPLNQPEVEEEADPVTNHCIEPHEQLM